MSSEKLRKYLAYYQKTLREDPENIEARLRLAALFREMGNLAHAIEEYVTASKLLAAQGLPLEAIAACKAVLELDPNHTEVRFFLARLFAQAPDAAGQGARVAQPVLANSEARRPVPLRANEISATTAGHHRDALRLEQLTTDEMRAFERSGQQPITLGAPKKGEEPPQGEVDDDTPTGVHVAVREDDIPTGVLDGGEVELPAASTRSYDALDPRSLDRSAQREDDETRMIPIDEPTLAIEHGPPFEDEDATLAASLDELEALRRQLAVREEDDVTFAASPEEIEAMRSQISDDMVKTAELVTNNLEELRETQAIDPEELAELERLSAPPMPAPSLLRKPPGEARQRRATLPLVHEPAGGRHMTGQWHPFDRSLQKHIDPELLQTSERDAASREDVGEDTLERARDETFELSVFDLEAVDLGSEELEGVLDGLSDELREELADVETEVHEDEDAPRLSSLINVRREDLPDIPLFSRLNQHAFVELLREVELREVSLGEVILAPGRERHSLFIIVRGQAEAVKHHDGAELFLDEIGVGEFFGEFGLLTGRDSSATVRARGDMVLLEITEDVIHRVAEYDPEIWDTLWDYYHVRMLNNLMVSDSIFRHLTPEVRDEVIDEFELGEYLAEELVLRPHEPCGHVHLVLFGELLIAPLDPNLPEKRLRAGEFLGFVASLSDDSCRARIQAVRDTSLLSLPARRFRELVRRYPPIAAQIRALLRERVTRNDLFLTGITSYADTGVGK